MLLSLNLGGGQIITPFYIIAQQVAKAIDTGKLGITVYRDILEAFDAIDHSIF